MSSLSSGLRATDSFITSTLQKFFFREIKLNDVASKNPELLKWNNALKRWAPTVPLSSSSLSTGAVAGVGTGGRGDEDSDGGAGDDTPSSSNTDRPVMPTKNNPLTVAIYGQMCIAAKSYQSAICLSYVFFEICGNH